MHTKTVGETKCEKGQLFCMQTTLVEEQVCVKKRVIYTTDHQDNGDRLPRKGDSILIVLLRMPDGKCPWDSFIGSPSSNGHPNNIEQAAGHHKKVDVRKNVVS
jgi:hypothetical protein